MKQSPREWLVVLVVEDDPFLLMDAVDMVEDAGFIAVAARNASEAIAHMEANPDIRVLFTDIDMPGSMDGLRLADYVCDRWPPVTIIVTSGLGTVEHTRIPAGGLFFSKPYQPRSIVTALDDVARGL